MTTYRKTVSSGGFTQLRLLELKDSRMTIVYDKVIGDRLEKYRGACSYENGVTGQKATRGFGRFME